MSAIRIVKDMDECAFLWKHNYLVESLFDLWMVRETFSQMYDREPCFIAHEKNGKVDGLLALCKISETESSSGSGTSANSCGRFAFFPGEVWKSRTWMEQNKIVASDSDIMREMLCAVPGNADIRYLCEKSLENIPPEFDLDNSVDKIIGNPTLKNTNRVIDNYINDTVGATAECSGDFFVHCSYDETGYLFYPEYHGYSYEQYLGVFAGKSRKKILSEVRSIEKLGVSFRYNDMKDLDHMFSLNISNFGEDGYFHDSRFLNAFIQLACTLQKHDMLRIVTVMIGDEIAAVDMGGIWNNTCIMLAGGTNKNFPGIAKLINLHHMDWACSQKISSLDFLCGDFSWKSRFHLSPRPLYQINITR
ncbi:MAG: GNAT family N-acetyltransferase [Desulfamplus sp.]|nr:GNAT family N-acetyltransferase [Desulfamplus sp.]